jgi:hypothetical protein
LNSNCSNELDMRNLQKQVKKAFCYQILFCPFTVCINYSSDLKIFANFRPSALNFKSFFSSLEQFFLMVGQNNFGNKIPLQPILCFATFCLLPLSTFPIGILSMKLRAAEFFKNSRSHFDQKSAQNSSLKLQFLLF